MHTEELRAKLISPEGAAAIESRLRQGERATPETIERCARQFGITANENMSLDLSLISKDANLNKGDLRAYFKFAKP